MAACREWPSDCKCHASKTNDDNYEEGVWIQDLDPNGESVFACEVVLPDDADGKCDELTCTEEIKSCRAILKFRILDGTASTIELCVIDGNPGCTRTIVCPPHVFCCADIHTAGDWSWQFEQGAVCGGAGQPVGMDVFQGDGCAQTSIGRVNWGWDCGPAQKRCRPKTSLLAARAKRG